MVPAMIKYCKYNENKQNNAKSLILKKYHT